MLTTVGESIRHCHGLPISKLNRSKSSDSKVSLDVETCPYESNAMIIQPYNVYIERTDKAENKARFYAMSIEPTLFGDASLLRRWGRIGSTGQQKIHCFENERQAVELFLSIVRQKRSRGYKPKLAPGLKF